ncbi:MAG: PaaI family thioesterase [bacterium]|nr:PaaI family thioesterase [bacterium]
MSESGRLGGPNLLPPALEVSYAADDFGHPTVTAVVCLGEDYQGPPGAVHGGYLAAMFDNLLGVLPYRLTGQKGAFTGRLTVRYRALTPLNAELVLTGRLTNVRSRRVIAAGQCHADGRLTAEAEALFVRPAAERS